MKKQFDLKYYLEHPDVRVVTRDGRNVRIFCTDSRNEKYPIVAECINNGYGEYVLNTYTTKGKFIANADEESNESVADLFFDIPEPEKKKVPLTYEDLYERVKKGKTMWLVSIIDVIYYIVDFNYKSLYYINGDERRVRDVPYKDIVDDYKFADGDPCYKEVDDE